MVNVSSLHRYFSEAFGADPSAMEPGDITVVRCPWREEPDPAAGEVERTAPVWIVVTAGRGIVSTSRFLHRVVMDWAEGFAAPDILLQRVFVEDLRQSVVRAMSGQVHVRRLRLLAPQGAVVNRDRAVRFVEASQANGTDWRQLCHEAADSAGFRCSCAMSRMARGSGRSCSAAVRSAAGACALT